MIPRLILALALVPAFGAPAWAVSDQELCGSFIAFDTIDSLRVFVNRIGAGEKRDDAFVNALPHTSEDKAQWKKSGLESGCSEAQLNAGGMCRTEAMLWFGIEKMPGEFRYELMKTLGYGCAYRAVVLTPR